RFTDRFPNRSDAELTGVPLPVKIARQNNAAKQRRVRCHDPSRE
ncbi:MAG: hypothetical protein ACJA0V_004871, partial [Planctomycetota bacterium]